MDLGKSAAPDSLKDLKELFLDDKTSAVLKKMKFITQKSQMFVQALDVFSKPTAIGIRVVNFVQRLLHIII